MYFLIKYYKIGVILYERENFMSSKGNNENKESKEIYEYIKHVDDKVNNNEEILKFITAKHSEQMKELIGAKTDGLRRFFEEAIKTQTEIVRNAYEEIITELKAAYEKNIKDREIENIRLYNQKEATLKSSYDVKIEAMLETAESECQKRINESYLKARTDFEEEKIALITKYQKEKQTIADKVTREYEERIVEINAWHEKNLSNKLEEQARFFEQKMQQTADESYINGKTDAEAWQDEAVRQKMEMQTQQLAQETEERIVEIRAWHEKNLNDKLEEMKNYYEQKIQDIWREHDDIVRQKLETQAEYFKEEIERAKEETKKEMYSQMDEAASRNEEELKLFLDFYEGKIKPFKKLINVHETADKRIKDIQQRIQRRFNKTFGDK